MISSFLQRGLSDSGIFLAVARSISHRPNELLTAFSSEQLPIFESLSKNSQSCSPRAKQHTPASVQMQGLLAILESVQPLSINLEVSVHAFLFSSDRATGLWPWKCLQVINSKATFCTLIVFSSHLSTRSGLQQKNILEARCGGVCL